MNKFTYLILLPMVLGPDMVTPSPATTGTSKLSPYKFYSTPATYEDARTICLEQNSDLAIITSLAEEHELLDLWKKSDPILNPSDGYDQQVFIGMNNLLDASRWETVRGDPLEYVNWSTNWSGGRQPSRPNEQRCGSLLRKGGMDDVDCPLKLGFICQSY